MAHKSQNQQANVVAFSRQMFSALSLGLQFTTEDEKKQFSDSLIRKVTDYQSNKRLEFKEEYIGLMTSELVKNKIGCTQCCKLCGVICDRDKDHQGKCYSNNHKYPALLGYVRAGGDKLYLEMNCNGIYGSGT